MTDFQNGGPEFAVAMRGYDRDQVDDYVTRITGWMSELQQRLTQAESRAADLEARLASTSTPGSYEALGTRIARILELAEEAAQETRKNAEEEATRQAEVARADIGALTEQREEATTALRRLRDQIESTLATLGRTSTRDEVAPAPETPPEATDPEATTEIDLPAVAAASPASGSV